MYLENILLVNPCNIGATKISRLRPFLDVVAFQKGIDDHNTIGLQSCVKIIKKSITEN